MPQLPTLIIPVPALLVQIPVWLACVSGDNNAITHAHQPYGFMTVDEWPDRGTCIRSSLAD